MLLVGFTVHRQCRPPEEAVMPSPQTQPTIEQERASSLLTMGFNATQAFLLAATRNGGDHVQPDEVRALLDAGCSHATAVRILL
jgi:hypothetical protein